MKTKILLQISIIILLGCRSSNSLEIENLTSNNWFDKYGNEYKFGTDKIEWKPSFGEIWWEIGKFQLEDNLMMISCSEDTIETYDLKIVSLNEDRIIFKESIQICESIPYVNEVEEAFEIWNNRENLIDHQEELILIEFKAQPEFLYGGIRNFRINKEKQVELSFTNHNTIDTTFILNDDIFDNIEQLIQIMPLEKFNEEYQFGIIDGVNFDIEIQTNKLSKAVSCKGSLPEGLSNLIQYLNSELREKNTTANKG